jgi:hypothetical protein
VLKKKSATSTARMAPEIISRVLTSRVIMLVSLERYMPRRGKRIKIPKLLALRTSLTLEETITLNKTLITMATGIRTKSKVAMFQFGK